MFKTQTNSKSAFTLLLLITLLIISTLVMVSNYFLRPGIETELRNRVISVLYSHQIFNAMIDVNGRDVVLKGITPNSNEAKKIEDKIQSIAGINELHSKLQIEGEIKPLHSIEVDQKTNN